MEMHILVRSSYPSMRERMNPWERLSVPGARPGSVPDLRMRSGLPSRDAAHLVHRREVTHVGRMPSQDHGRRCPARHSRRDSFSAGGASSKVGLPPVPCEDRTDDGLDDDGVGSVSGAAPAFARPDLFRWSSARASGVGPVESLACLGLLRGPRLENIPAARPVRVPKRLAVLGRIRRYSISPRAKYDPLLRFGAAVSERQDVPVRSPEVDIPEDLGQRMRREMRRCARSELASLDPLRPASERNSARRNQLRTI